MRLLARAVGHSYEDLEVLDGIDLEVGDGEVVALVGPSGCGKSTLLGILGGLLRPARGEVLTAGDPPSGSLVRIAYVFQDFALLPWRTVAANVALPLEHHPLAPAERRERVAAALAMTGLAEFAGALPRQLSGGMRQRVGIARALAVQPAALLLDEPLSALDAQTRELLADDFLRLWGERSTTAVYVTHNLLEALTLADRVVVLSRRPGRIRDVVRVPVVRAERRTPAAQAELARLHDRLWDTIRGEAAAADRELSEA